MSRWARYYRPDGKERDWYCEDVLSGKLVIAAGPEVTPHMQWHATSGFSS